MSLDSAGLLGCGALPVCTVALVLNSSGMLDCRNQYVRKGGLRLGYAGQR